ncbi:hypothetical protein HJC23_013589 [Cyclotella cryptica]|uniref:Uncharacterized protein n=1 Tax=Cyclotella cryptica TaxID=29204 RepID=A0ABD3PRM0_9STRA
MAKLLQGSNSQGFSPTTNWSHNEYNMANTQDTSSAISKKVSFSKYSTKRVYVTDTHYENCKSYSSADQKTFRKVATHDAIRIKHLLSNHPLPTALAIHELMRQGLLTREDLIGIEHLVSTNVGKVTYERRSYINFVLGVQKQMREINENKVNAEMLAAAAVAKSSRMIEKARLRASLAL